MEKDKNYWREMAEVYHTTVKGLHHHVLVSKMTGKIARDIGNEYITEHGNKEKEIMNQKETPESVVRYHDKLKRKALN